MIKKLWQLIFCPHKETRWFMKDGTFSNLSGDTHYEICQRCGKVISERFIRHD